MSAVGNPVDIACRSCGSLEVSRDAWADWDAADQRWVLGAVFDAAICHACDRETSLVEVARTKITGDR